MEVASWAAEEREREREKERKEEHLCMICIETSVGIREKGGGRHRRRRRRKGGRDKSPTKPELSQGGRGGGWEERRKQILILFPPPPPYVKWRKDRGGQKGREQETPLGSINSFLPSFSLLLQVIKAFFPLPSRPPSLNFNTDALTPHLPPPLPPPPSAGQPSPSLFLIFVP